MKKVYITDRLVELGLTQYPMHDTGLHIRLDYTLMDLILAPADPFYEQDLNLPEIV
jgi:hypothetical protein